jgi:glycosyltransferase involved in cell wall biosynthesis
MQPLTVLHLIETDGLYGAERVVLGLARQSKLEGSFKPFIGCIVSGAAAELARQAADAGIETATFTVRPRMVALDVAALLLRARKIKPAVIHTHGYKAAIVGYSLSVLLGVPIITTCHLWFETDSLPLTYRFLTAVERRLYRRFDHVVAVSTAIADVVRSAGVPHARVSCIPNGIDVADEVVGVPADTSPADQPFTIATLGRLVEQKAQHLIISAVAQLLSGGFNCRAVIAGDGPLRSQLREQARRMDVADKIQFLGFRRDIGEVLSAADVFVLPSVDEGLPMALLEAMARGLPVVATPVGAIPSVVTHERNGLLIPTGSSGALASAIAGILSQAGTRRELGLAGQATIRERFSSARMFRDYLAVYLQLVSSPH